jgi:hypothetical protein
MADVPHESELLDLDPAPTYATNEELKIAAELWRALERKYLGSASLPLDGAQPRSHGTTSKASTTTQ